MKFICTRENFKRAIFNLERVVSKQTTLPILNNILFEVEGGSLRLSATNLEIGAVVSIAAKTEKEGRLTIPAKLISNFINNLPSGDNLEFEVIDQSLKIKSGSAKAIIKGLSANDFPIIPKKTMEFQLQIANHVLRSTINKIITSIAFNEARPELTGINLILRPEELVFAATDSFRLSESRIMIEAENVNNSLFGELLEKTSSLIIPATTMQEVIRIISIDEADFVKITIEDGQIFFEFRGTTLVSRLINGKYPEYQHIIPGEFKTTIIGEKSEFQSAIKMASLFAPGKTSEIALKMDSESGTVFIEARNGETGENSTELKLDTAGPSQEVVFNSKYLLDGMNTISSSKVAVLINAETSPVALREVDEKSGELGRDYIYIVMPIKN
jgi:DNA polymerase-3 subunit beta